jgi:hypothetical protein
VVSNRASGSPAESSEGSLKSGPTSRTAARRRGETVARSRSRTVWGGVLPAAAGRGTVWGGRRGEGGGAGWGRDGSASGARGCRNLLWGRRGGGTRGGAGAAPGGDPPPRVGGGVARRGIMLLAGYGGLRGWALGVRAPRWRGEARMEISGRASHNLGRARPLVRGPDVARSGRRACAGWWAREIGGAGSWSGGRARCTDFWPARR